MVTASIDTVPYSEAARRALRPEDCALAVIDIQEKLLPPIFEKKGWCATPSFWSGWPISCNCR